MRYIRSVSAADDVARGHETAAHGTEAMGEQIREVEGHLHDPEWFTSTRSKGWYRRDGRAISWFKPEAAEAISRARALAGLLDSCGVFISAVTTIRPGVVTYEDALQIVAEPFAATAC